MYREQFKSALYEFDGIAVSILSEARVKFRKDEEYLLNLVELSGDAESRISDGATWILKEEVSDGIQLPKNLSDKLIQNLPHISSWQAVLHIFQTIHLLNFSEDQIEKAIEWSKKYTQHERPFIRAWSMNAIVMLGRGYQKFYEDVELYLKNAEQDKAASVRARARNLRKNTGCQ